jgi:hypothetical protein
MTERHHDGPGRAQTRRQSRKEHAAKEHLFLNRADQHDHQGQQDRSRPSEGRGARGDVPLCIQHRSLDARQGLQAKAENGESRVHRYHVEESEPDRRPSSEDGLETGAQ